MIILSLDKAKDVKKWEEAIEEEINAPYKNKTCDKSCVKAYKYRSNYLPMSYKVKHKSDESMDYYKVRLIRGEFSLKYGEDYKKTF